MSIRSAAKAVIVRDGCVLLQLCETRDGARYYELPGGGQQAGETMEAAVRRECLEETGYTVHVERCLALMEEILDDAAMAVAYPGYAHRIFHVFVCTLKDAPRQVPSEEDDQQIDMIWTPLGQTLSFPMRPAALWDALPSLLAEEGMAYLGSRRFHALTDT